MVFAVLVGYPLREQLGISPHAVQVHLRQSARGGTKHRSYDLPVYGEPFSHVQRPLEEARVDGTGFCHIVSGVKLLPEVGFAVLPERCGKVRLPASVGEDALLPDLYHSAYRGGEKAVIGGLVRADVQAVFALPDVLCDIALKACHVAADLHAVYVQLKFIVADEFRSDLFVLPGGEVFPDEYPGICLRPYPFGAGDAFYLLRSFKI